MRNINGITLIALIVTIIILLILVGISINIIFGGEGIIEKAQWASYVTEYESVNEQKQLYKNEQIINQYGNTKSEKTADLNSKSDIIHQYPVGEKIEVSTISKTLEQSIIKKENLLEEDIKNEQKVNLYKVDFTKIDKIQATKEYTINIVTGELYSIQAERYKKHYYHTPKIGIINSGDSVEENKTIKIHYLSGYDSTSEYTQDVQNKIGTITLKNIQFNREKWYFVKWKDVTNKYIPIEEESLEEDEEEIFYENEDEIEIEGVDVYLEAQWTQETIILNANGGKINEQEEVLFPVIEGDTYGEIPDAERDGYVFGGWHTDKENYIEQIVGTDIYSRTSGITTLYAYWVPESSSNIAIIQYNANGGRCIKESKKVVKGKKIGKLPTKKQTKKDTYVFDCWTLEDMETRVGKSYIVTGDITLYARYTIHMIFDYQGGIGKTVYKNVKIGGKRGYLYTDEKKTGSKNQGWYTEKYGNGVKIDYNTIITQTTDFTIYAYWTEPLEIIISIISPSGRIGTEVNVDIDYKLCTKEQQYKIGENNKEWLNYSGGFNINSNQVLENGWKNEDNTVTLYAKGRDINGNEKIEEKVIDLLDLDAPQTPSILISGRQYPLLTEYGMNFECSAEIEFDSRTDIKNYYSIDGGKTWNLYSEKLTNIRKPIIYAKSVKESTGLEIITNKKVNLANDALEVEACDDDINTYVSFGTNTTYNRFIEVSPEMQGKNINITYDGNNYGTMNLYYYDKDGGDISNVEIKGRNENGRHSKILTIPEETTKMKVYINTSGFNGRYIYIYELAVENSPVINNTQIYPIITSSGVNKGYDSIKINYFQTSVQKLYKIGEDEWKHYEGQTINIENGQTIYAKGIDKYGTETGTISNYTSSLISDALEVSAYDKDESTYVSLSSGTKRIEVDENMWDKKIYIHLYTKDTNVKYNQILFKDSEGTSLKVLTYGTRNSTGVTKQISELVPEKTKYIDFYSTPGNNKYYLIIYEVKPES